MMLSRLRRRIVQYVLSSGSAFVTPTADATERGCQPHVEVRMTARVRTSDGVLDERVPGLLQFGEHGLTSPSSAQSASSQALFALSIPSDAIAGSLTR